MSRIVRKITDLCECGCGEPVALKKSNCGTKSVVQSPLSRRCLVLKQRWGLTFIQRENMLSAQDYKCRTCSSEIVFGQYGSNGRQNTAVIDHCHATGNIRGILCASCNIVLGNVKDNKNTLLRMVEYLS